MNLKTLRRSTFSVVALASVLAPAAASASSGGTLFIPSAVEHSDDTVTLPLHVGTSHGRTVYYIITDTSDGKTSAFLGVNRSQKLANAVNTGAVQHVNVVSGVVDFPATVDFSPARVVIPGPQGFPPAAAQPGAVGEPGYSPLIQLPNGVVENASQLANDTGVADKVVSIDVAHLTVTFRETHGFQGGKAVRYISTDSSSPVAAALEGVTYAPALNSAPSAGDDSTASARASLAAFTNGQLGASNPQQQGLNSALLDGLDPRNLLAWNPSQGRYSPLWDVYLTQWSPSAISSGTNFAQTDFGTVMNLANHGIVVGFDGSAAGTAFGASGFIVNCPIVSSL